MGAEDVAILEGVVLPMEGIVNKIVHTYPIFLQDVSLFFGETSYFLLKSEK